MTRPERRRLAWGLTGSGHFLRECLELARELRDVDFFLTKAAEEVLHMYGHRVEGLREGFRVFRDTTASAAPVGLFYHGHYHTVIVAPATSNTVAKCVAGISDTLVTNIFAQAGKVRVPSIVFACDTAPEMQTESPKEWVTVYPRPVDLEATARLKAFPSVSVVETLDQLRDAIRQRMAELDAQPDAVVSEPAAE
ncbi:MAG: dihydromethanopterin reductase [Burkholderiales bacterium]|nr:dihydromethanopterin reductase [Burkholderiales bacterium]